jgi:CRP/FNR family transcriptional regulator, cyclic AMP receptor protein
VEPTPFLEKLEPDELKDLRGSSRPRKWPRGTTLFNEGEHSDRVVVITEGRVKVSYFTEGGKEVVLAVRGPGDVLGEFSAFDDEPRSATATAIESVETLIITSEQFKDFLVQHGRVALEMLRDLTGKMRDADRKRVEFSAFDTVGRVARRVVELAEKYGRSTEEGVRIELPLSQEELAGWTGSSREAVAKALQTLRSRGLVETHRKAMTVIDLEGLKKRAT